MKLAQDIVIKPIITERSMSGIAQGKYTFEVHKDANKIEIANAIETLFPGTKVAAVNTMNVSGKQKRMGRNVGTTRSWKKAVVTIKADSKKIEFFESMI
ncbi:MAG: 50S ribosomal protein L23 [Oscillospiraceae bacterium]|nr:50S ribosomal protein L23 [Oscillospiraceae bacterium]